MRFVISSFRKFICGFGLMVATATAVCHPPSIAAQTTTYLLTDLSSDDATQVPCKLNNHGDVVGRGSRGAVAAQTQATLWNHSSFSKKRLGVFAGGDYSSATSINDAGEITAVSNTETGIIPFLWTLKGGSKRVRLLPGDNCGQVNAINRYGHVVGYSSGKSGMKAFFWARKGSLRQLATLAGGDYSKARDLNDRDEIVGTSGSSAGGRAVLWSKDGSVRDLGTLPGDSASEAIAVNNDTEVVGYSAGPRGMHAFYWTQSAGMQDLGVLPGGDSSRALAINNFGQVVGSSSSASGDHAFAWTRQVGMVDLNSASSAALGVALFEAHSINDQGQILAMGQSSTSSTMNDTMSLEHTEACAPAPPTSFLLTPVSTP